MFTQKMRALSYIGAKHIAFPPKAEQDTDRQSYRQTNMIDYRVAPLVKIMKI